MAEDRSPIVRKFPRKRGVPATKPMCGQCGETMARGFPNDSDFLSHDLQSGVELRLRILAEDSDPHRCGIVNLEISERGIVVGWLGTEDVDEPIPVPGALGAIRLVRPRFSWADLIDILRAQLMPEGKFTIVRDDDE